MGNTTSNNTSGNKRRSSSKSKNKRTDNNDDEDENMAARAQKVVGDFQAGIASGIKKLEEQDHPAAALLDSMCGPYLDKGLVRSYYSEDASEDDSRTVSEEETMGSDYRHRRHNNKGKNHQPLREDETTVDSRSYVDSEYDAASSTQQDISNNGRRGKNTRTDESSYETEDDDTYTASRVTTATSAEENTTVTTTAVNTPAMTSMMMSKMQPLASSFAKRCYFTKAGIGGHTQHYEGLTLTGNVVLMLAAAMKLKGCPTICDEDLRRVEQTYPNQFSRLPDELLLSSGWRRISKYCHFSNKPVPDGIPFFHSKQRLHPSGGYYFLLAAAVGMVRPIDVEPLNRDTLVLLETDYPSQCDAAPAVLIQDPAEWTLVDKFCFFSGGPINTDEDVYYMADFDGNPIYMLAFLSPSLTPSELYKLESEEPLGSTAAVIEVESVYDLTERDFDDLKLYHLGPCRALPQYILQPQAWTKVLPPHFLAARETALMRAQDYEEEHGIVPPRHEQQPYIEEHPSFYPDEQAYPLFDQPPPHYGPPQHHQQHLYGQQPYSYGPPQQYGPPQHQEQLVPQSRPYGGHGHERYDAMFHQHSPAMMHDNSFMRNVKEEGAFIDNSVPIDEAIAAHAARAGPPAPLASAIGIDPPEDEPPSLRKRGVAYGSQSVSSGDPSQRSAYDSQRESGSGFMEQGSAYHGSAYQDGSAYDDGVEPHNSYYQEDADNFGEEYRREAQYQPDDEYDQQEEYQPDDEYDRQEDFRPDDEYDRQEEFRPDDEHDRQEEYQSGGGYDRKEEYLPDDEYDRQEEYQPDDVSYEGGNNIVRGSYDDITPQPSDEPFSTAYSRDDDYDESASVGKEQIASPTSGSEFSVPTVSDGGFAGGPRDMSPNTTADYYSPRPQTTRRGNSTSQFPPTSPRSTQGSEYSQSSAMRGAQELLRRNRQKRLELAQRMKQPLRQYGDEAGPGDEGHVPDVISPQSHDSGSTWQTGVSEYTGSEATGASSIWTDGENPDRSSRRALILQMARARMKSHGKGEPAVPGEEKKLDHVREAKNEIDLTGDLD